MATLKTKAKNWRKEKKKRKEKRRQAGMIGRYPRAALSRTHMTAP